MDTLHIHNYHISPNEYEEQKQTCKSKFTCEGVDIARLGKAVAKQSTDKGELQEAAFQYEDMNNRAILLLETYEKYKHNSNNEIYSKQL